MKANEPKRTPPRLLFVDDEESTLAMYRRILSSDSDEWGAVGEMNRPAERVFETRGNPSAGRATTSSHAARATTPCGR
jgi:hypothetical protein